MESQKNPPLLESIPISQLYYDLKNPRLPLELHEKGEADLAQYYYVNDKITELMDSMLASGFFSHEPLIIVKEGGNHYKVVEGNRRLTALKILNNHGSTKDISNPASESQYPFIKQNLSSVPCAIIENRENIKNYIGFRHIGGQKTWRPEAKARFVTELVDEAFKNNEADPFKYVGKKIGSNAQGVRSYYTSYGILKTARENDINTAHIESSRFGVWERVSSVKEVRDFLNFKGGSTYQEIISSLEVMDLAHCKKVVADITPRNGEHKALLQDSRNANIYGLILANDSARKILHDSRDFETAKTIVADADIAVKIDAIDRKLQALTEQLKQNGAHDEAVDAAKRLSKSAKLLELTAQTFLVE